MGGGKDFVIGISRFLSLVVVIVSLIWLTIDLLVYKDYLLALSDFVVLNVAWIANRTFVSYLNEERITAYFGLLEIDGADYTLGRVKRLSA